MVADVVRLRRGGWRVLYRWLLAHARPYTEGFDGPLFPGAFVELAVRGEVPVQPGGISERAIGASLGISRPLVISIFSGQGWKRSSWLPGMRMGDIRPPSTRAFGARSPAPARKWAVRAGFFTWR